MGSVWHLRAAGKVIQPIQTGLLGDWIHPAQQQIHIVWLSAPQAPGQFASDEAGDRARSQIGLVAHRVECDICLDELGELNGVTSFSGERKEGVFVQLSGLVI